MRKLFIVTLLLFFTLSNGSVWAFYYVNPASLPPQIISSPPQKDSDIIKNEVAQIIALQKTASKERIKMAEYESRMRVGIVTEAVKDFNAKNSPLAFAMLENVRSDCHDIVHQAKDYYKTTRPYLVESKIKAVITPPGAGNFAYPSGHTACAIVLSESLAQIFPAQSQNLRKRAAEIAESRVIGGVHWPHDVEAGRKLGYMIFGALLQSAKYQADLAKAKDEAK